MAQTLRPHRDNFGICAGLPPVRCWELRSCLIHTWRQQEAGAVMRQKAEMRREAAFA